MKRPLLALAVGIAALLLFSPAAGARAEPKFIHGYTLGHAYVQHQWTMVIVNVANEGDEPIRLQVVLSVQKDVREVQYMKPLYLPAYCERSAWFYAQLGEEQTYGVKLVTPDGVYASKGGEWSNVLSWTRLLILTMDQERLLPALNLFLSRREAYADGPMRHLFRDADQEVEEEYQELGWQIPGQIRRPATLGTRLPMFPDHWAGLDSLSAVAVGEQDHTQ